MTHSRSVLVLFLLLSTTAAAQTTGSAPQEPPPLRIGPVTLGGYLQADALTTSDDEKEEAVDTFRIRRARVSIGGDFAPKIGFALSAELSGTPHVRDAYLQLRFTEQFQVRLGQFYPPLGLERLTSTSRLEVIDRSRVTETVTYERNPGVMVMNGKPYGGWLSYSLGAFNGTGMNRSDNNDAKDVTGRVVLTPPRLGGWGVGLNASSGDQPEGTRSRAGVDLSIDKPAYKFAVEALRETNDDGPTREGFYVLGVYRVRPAQATPHFRMLELTARYTAFDDPSIARAETPTRSLVPVSTREIQAGGNYYATRNIRFMANVIVPVDDRDAPGAVLISRLQIIF